MFLFLGRGHLPTIDDVIRTVIRAACAVTRERRQSVATANRTAFLECGGKRSATPLFLCSVPRAFAIIWRSTQEGSHRNGKAPSSLRFAGAFQNAPWHP